jgi:lia operon protein LiaF
MSNHKKTDYISRLAMIGLVVLFIEVTFFNSGVIFSGFLSGVAIYIGRKKFKGTLGKLVFWLGCISLFFTIANMITVKFLLIGIIVYFVLQYFQSKKNPTVIKPEIEESTTVLVTEEPIIKTKSLFENVFIGRQKTSEHVYEWHDINIQTGIGDTTIDLSNTVLPKGESIITIRNFVGNVEILVPYEMEASIHHSVITGSTTIFQHEEKRVFNQVLSYQTEEYKEAEQKIKIVTSFLIGNLEVKRV